MRNRASAHIVQRIGAAVIVILSLLLIGPSALAALPGSDPGDPGDPPPGGDPIDRAVECLAGVRGSIQQSGSTFGGPSTVSWSYTAPSGCGVAFRLGVETVPRVSSRVVDPSVTRSYGLQAVMLGVIRSLGSTTVVAGDVVTYSGSHTGARVAGVTAAEEIVDALPDANRRELLGKSVEVHLVPDALDIPDLPPWSDKRGKKTPDGRPFEELAGIGGRLVGTNRIAMAVDEKELLTTSRAGEYPRGFVLAHEIGHLIQDFSLTSTQESRVMSCFDDRTDAGGPWLDPDSYSQSSAKEYYANGTAATFSYPHSSQGSTKLEYTPSWLSANDRCLFNVVNAVYALR